jgi:uncharacterized membrane protein
MVKEKISRRQKNVSRLLREKKQLQKERIRTIKKNKGFYNLLRFAVFLFLDIIQNMKPKLFMYAAIT